MSIVINSSKVELSTVIEFVNNPKRAGKKAHGRYEEYQHAESIEEYFAIVAEQEIPRAVAMADLRYDLAKGFMSIVDEESSYEGAWRTTE